MKLKFTKMHGCGNDYIYIDCINNDYKFNIKEVAIKLSNRHFGVGGDGLVLICKSDKADAFMRMFNADGTEGKMCGNAIRCVSKFLYDEEITKKKSMKIETLSGIKNIDLIIKDDFAIGAKVNMGFANFDTKDMPIKTKEKEIISKPIEVDGKEYKITCVSMGNPHCVVFLDDIKSLNVNEIGEKFEKVPIFEEEVNIEFVKIIEKNFVEMRVYERGSKETLACGTGACACVAALYKNKYIEEGEEVEVKLLGGILKVIYTGEEVFMTGEAKKIFCGEIEI